VCLHFVVRQTAIRGHETISIFFLCFAMHPDQRCSVSWNYQGMKIISDWVAHAALKITFQFSSSHQKQAQKRPISSKFSLEKVDNQGFHQSISSILNDPSINDTNTH
jgi:hypothetical protein